MKAEITTSYKQSYYPDRFINGFNVFVKCNASKLIDEWFSENKIYSLDFKCKTWSKAKRAASKLTIGAMREKLFGDEYAINYSLYAGCSCPCSPGYRVRRKKDSNTVGFFTKLDPNTNIVNHNLWVTVEVDVSALKERLPELTKELQEEIKNHSK